MRLSIVIPAFNEARRLPKTLEAVVRFLDQEPRWRPAEIIVIDDGSSDGTAGVVDCAPELEGITLRCATHATNRGKGAAARTGFAMSRGDEILLCDADLATPISEIERLAGAAPGGIALGSRALDRGRQLDPAENLGASRFFLGFLLRRLGGRFRFRLGFGFRHKFWQGLHFGHGFGLGFVRRLDDDRCVGQCRGFAHHSRLDDQLGGLRRGPRCQGVPHVRGDRRRRGGSSGREGLGSGGRR